MQSIIDTVKQAASSAATYTGITTHSHAEEDQSGAPQLPPDAQASAVSTVDSEALAVFEETGLKHEVLVKIRKLAVDDEIHGLKEVAALKLFNENGELKNGISFYHPKRFFTVTRLTGIDYIGEIEVSEGKCIHVRAHKASATTPATFHSIDTRPSAEGGAIFTTGEPLAWFDY